MGLILLAGVFPYPASLVAQLLSASAAPPPDPSSLALLCSHLPFITTVLNSASVAQPLLAVHAPHDPSTTAVLISASAPLATTASAPPVLLAPTRLAFLILLVLVALLRLFELRLSRRNQRRLSASGAVPAPDPAFRWMVLLHTAILLGAAVEVTLLRRPFLPLLALLAGIFFLAANAVRAWVIATLGSHWNVQVMDARRLGFVSGGPYRWVRHPNYAAVFVEMLALPLIHTAWLTAVLGSAAHLLVLGRRVRAEDAVLLSNPAYRTEMAAKPRFFPRLFSSSPAKRSPLPGNPIR